MPELNASKSELNMFESGLNTPELEALYKSCVQCPRRCKADRTKASGICGEGAGVRIATACLHFGEEPPVTVFGGSGTIFFTGCTLRCAFCQNYQISQKGMGRAVDSAEFTDICLALQNAGAENINLVTPSHHIPVIAKCIADAKMAGLAVPVCWNSSGYESAEMLSLLKDLVDIWLPDFKTLDSDFSRKVFAAPDYPDAAKAALLWMLENSPLEIKKITKNGETKEKITSGVIIRHLFMPGRFEDTAEVLGWLKENADGRAIISLMSQYTPVPFKESGPDSAIRQAALSAIENRLVSSTEDSDIRDLIDAYDFDYLFYQDLSTDTDWLPDFSRIQPFSNKLARPIWHYGPGLIK